MIKYITDFLNIVAGMDEKGWYLSKTQWFNIISLISVALAYYGVIDVGLTQEEITMLAAAVIPVVNMIIRGWFTRVPLTKNILPDGKVAKAIKQKEAEEAIKDTNSGV